MKKQLIISFAVFALLALTTVLVVLYGKGYRFGFNQGKLELAGTGLLVATSTPDGAQVFVNGHLTTATDNTINLPEGQYDVRIFKEGYQPWEKKIVVQEQVVSKADALLFPTAPTLESITSTGVQNPTIDPSLTRLAYTVASESARKNGIYILDMTTRPILTLQGASTQIVDDTLDLFSNAALSWSPDGQEILASITAQKQTPTVYLLKASGFNDSPSDVTATIEQVTKRWETDRKEKEKARIESLKKALSQIAATSFSIIAWSPDETKILYQASASAQLPVIITPRLIGTNPTGEDRNLRENSLYVYDTKEDKNYRIDAKLPLAWTYDSKHLIYVHDKKIDIMEYDGKNQITIYAGPFISNYVFQWPNASKVVILTNLGNPTIAPNLYTIGLK